MLPSAHSRRVVALYEADLTLFSVSSTFERSGDAVATHAIARCPEWMPFSWPAAQPDDDDLLDALALMKLLTVFEFGSGIPATSPQDIRDELLARNPEIGRQNVSGAADWKLIKVEARILDDGHFGAQFTHPEEGTTLPLRDRSEETYDEFIKNMVRADIRELLDRRFPGWGDGGPFKQT